MLDDALFRRFDDVITYELPDGKLVRELIENRLTTFDLSGIEWENVSVAASGLSHAEVARACDDAARTAVLSGDKTIRSKDLAQVLSNRDGMRTTRQRKNRWE
jgi:AAA+ superfamily predicted ATPase